MQKIDGEEHDSQDLEVTIVEGGTVVPKQNGPVDLERGGTTDVPFSVENKEARAEMQGKVELAAPAGTTFADGQTNVAAEVRTGDTGSWTPNTALDLKNGNLSDGGKKLTFDVDSGATELPAGQEYRYTVKVDTPADAAAGTDELGFVYAGDSSKGDYRAEGTTTTTLEADNKPGAPTSVEGYFPQDVAAWAHIKGDGITSGATVTIKQGEKVIASQKVTGTAFDLPIDPSKVGYGKQDFTVTQTIDGTESDNTAVSLDYGDEGAVAITSPTGPTVAGSGSMTFTGTATAGSTVTVTGTDFANDSLFGSATAAADNNWSLTASLDLPAGPYQFWASQMTKGGKVKLTATSVEITR
ncbi:Ig-like domain-containing protein [Curtobacterium sp. MCPF17_046]|uniref:Ig-like domain-containing protein n=1 Tax=Curtobacterium sp. MCPF17_046 TaxID=2175663 RepID=UPI000D832283|nr:Ig-like domain-containing protein [Curtobacterium sp. MCPF17_046]PYY39100.1 hypothetical protein DEJ32_09160 [Curtobacterium sp. MCPF17_046]